jgi:hypothetical protein
VSDGAEMTKQSFLFSSTNTAPTAPPISSVTVAHNAPVPTISVSATDNENDPLTYSLTVNGDNPLYDVQVQYGLTRPNIAAATSVRGDSELYFQSTNGSNPAGMGYFVLMPTDKLYAYVPDAANDLAATLAQPAVIDFTPYGNVYANPKLLYNAAAPAAPETNADRGPLYDVQFEYGLTAPAITADFNQHGFSEEYFHSSNGSNAKNGGLFVLMPTGLLYAWDGFSIPTTISQPPLANLGPYGVYADTSLLTDAAPVFTPNPDITAEVPNVTATIDASGHITITPNVAFYGTVRVGVAISDGLAVTDESFLFTVTNGAPTVMPSDDATVIASTTETGNTVTVTTAVAHGLLVGETVSISGVNVPGYNGIVTIATVPTSTAFTYADATSGLIAASAGTVTYVATISTATELGSTVTIIPNANVQLIVGDQVLIAGVSNSAYDGVVTVTSVFSGGYAFTYTANESGLPSASGGTLTPLTGSTPVTVSSSAQSISIALNTLDPEGDPLQYSASVAANPLFAIQQQFGLTQYNGITFNLRGADERYLQSTNGSNPAGGGYYVLMPNDMLYAWDGSLPATLTQVPVADFAPYANVYANIELLVGATQSPVSTINAVISNQSSGGTLTLSWPAGYFGSFLVTVVVGDGAIETQQSFLVTVS